MIRNLNVTGSQLTLSRQARVQEFARGGAQNLKAFFFCKKKVIRANFKLFHLYFATVSVGNIFYLVFSELPPPPREILKSKKKKKIIRANFKLFHLYLATFLVGNIILSAIF